MEEVLTRYPAVIVVMALLSVAEWAWAHRTGRNYDARASLASFGVALGQMLIKPTTGVFVAAVFTIAYGHALLHLSTADWSAWLIGFFVVEFAYYWFHRWSHTINWLWATHAVHHSANELTLPAAIRLGWTGVFSGGWLIFVAVALIGFPPLMIGVLLAINLIYQFVLHTETIRHLGPLEWVLNTPSHHRAHHASDKEWLDCNFSGVLILFDRLFDSFVAEAKDGGLTYGLTEPIASYNPFTIALRQWLVMGRTFSRAAHWRERWVVLFGRPGQLTGIGTATSASRKLAGPMARPAPTRAEEWSG